MKKWACVIICAALCLAVCVGGALVTLTILRRQPETPQYELREYNGQAALFDGDSDAPLAQYDIYTALLPDSDAALLREGIPVSGREELQRLLEDFGL